MANPAKTKAKIKKEKELGPMPVKPEFISEGDWKVMTEAAKRIVGRCKSAEEHQRLVDTLVVQELHVPQEAQHRVNGAYIRGRCIMSHNEYLATRNLLVYRSVHDRLSDEGRLGIDSTFIIGD